VKRPGISVVWERCHANFTRSNAGATIYIMKFELGDGELQKV
jgi:hypothetical protein